MTVLQLVLSVVAAALSLYLLYSGNVTTAIYVLVAAIWVLLLPRGF